MPTWETSAQKRVENSGPVYGADTVEMKPLHAGSPYAWVQEKNEIPTGYNFAPSLPYGNAANEYCSNQSTGFYDNGGSRDGVDERQAYSTYNNQVNTFDSTPYLTPTEGMRYEPYRTRDRANMYSESQPYENTPGFLPQQIYSNPQSSMKPVAGAWRDI